jgi:hypothetical protein
MRRRDFSILSLGLTAAWQACTADSEAGFLPLFDGKTLEGWEGDPRLWSVQDGAIVGSTEGVDLTDNSFLTYKKREFADFILRADVKLRNGNSGIQFRSEQLPNHVVKGYQADMAEGNWWGSIYDEKGTRGVMVNGWKGKAEKVVRPTDWNQVEVYAKGDHIRVTVNDLVTAELNDDLRLQGIIALQLHRGPAMQVSFRNLRIRTLD